MQPLDVARGRHAVRNSPCECSIWKSLRAYKPIHKGIRSRSSCLRGRINNRASVSKYRQCLQSGDKTARIWDVTWATLIRDDALRERVWQEFSDGEIENDPILRGIDKNNPVARNPCLRRGSLSLDYWTGLPEWFWRSTCRLLGVN